MEWTCSSAPITCSMGTDLEPVAYLCKRQFRRNAMIRNDYSKSRLLVIKQATAKALGVTIPESFLLRADDFHYHRHAGEMRSGSHAT